MGICTSFNRTTTTAATVKLVHEDGRLSEFQTPIRVSEILQSNTNNLFICDSDELGWDEYISAIDDEDELQLDHIYLELPSFRLNNPITPEEMSELAFKISLAVQNVANGGGRCWWFPISFSDYFKSNKSDNVEVNSEDRTPLVQIDGGIVRGKLQGGGGGGGGRRGGGGGGRQKKFISQLSVILEGQEINDINLN